MYYDELKPLMSENWCVIENQFELSKVRHYESVMALGTGYMTTRSSFDEGFLDDEQNISYDRIPGNVSLEVAPCKKSRWGTFIQRVQGKHPFWNVGIVNLPYYLGLVLYADGERLDMENSQISGYCRFLDLKTATLYRSFVWTTAQGKQLDVMFRRYMDPALRFVCAQEVRVRAICGSVELKAESYIDNDVRTNGFDKFTSRQTAYACNHYIYSDVTTNLGDRIVTASKLSADRAGSYQTVKESDFRISSSLTVQLPEGEETMLRKFSAEMTSIYYDPELLLDEAVTCMEGCFAKTSEECHAAHAAQWAQKWAVSDIEIDAQDDEGYNSQRAIRMAIYHLFRARSTDPHALNCAKGTTSEAYLGSVCWDMEMFFQPFYIYTQPELAKMTPMYRYLMLDGARRSAKSMNYPGARYPWQTDRKGDEVCSLFEYADHEIHITADIIVGMWHYFLNTNDKDFLYHCGLEMIIETARYWTARVDKIEGLPGYHIYGCMGPDEYKPISNDNAYTNYVAAFNLHLVGKVCGMMRQDAPEEYAALCEKLSFNEAEIALYDEIADGLPILKDEDRHLIWQCQNFEDGYATIDIDRLWLDRTKLFGFFTTQEKRYRSKCLKQSDVLALLGVFTEAFTAEEMAACYDYYNQYTIHDSSNSLCHNTVVAAAIGRPDEAYLNWKKSMDIDFGARPRSSDGIHFANVGGMWQEVVHGFGGFVNALGSDALRFHPCLPKQIQAIRYKLNFKGQWVDVAVSHERILVTNRSNSPLTFYVNAASCTLLPGEQGSVNL